MPPQMGSHLGGAWQGMPLPGLPQLQMDPQARQWTGIPPIDPSQHIAMQSPGGGGGGGGFSGFGGHRPNAYNPGGHISGGIASGSYNMPNDARPPIPPGYPVSQADGPVQAQGKAWYGPTPPQSAPGSPPPLPQRAPPSAPNLAAPGYSFGATPGMAGTSADAWNQSDKPHVSEGYGPSAHAWTPRAAMGGHFMPGQSAIVGDRPNGKPGPNAEVVTAMPGGGFVVTPNPKNMPPLPRFAAGTPPGQVYGDAPPLLMRPAAQAMNAEPASMPSEAYQAWHNAGVPPPLPPHISLTKPALPPPPAIAPSPVQSYIDQQNAIANPPGFWDTALAPVAKILHNPDVADYFNGTTEFRTLPEDELQRHNAAARAAFAKKTGRTSDMLPPPTSPSPVGKILGPPPLDPAVAPFMKGAMGYHPDLGPTAFGSPPPHDAPPVPATPEPAWSPQQLNAYALRQQTNEHLGLKRGDANWIDPNEAAKQMGATPQPEGPMMAAVDPTARANSILQGWQSQKMPEGPPPGLSPIAGRAWQEQRARMANTREGRAQILNTEMVLKGIQRGYAHEVDMKNLESGNAYLNQEAGQQHRDARMREHMAWQTQMAQYKRQEDADKNAPKNIPLAGGGNLLMVGNKPVRIPEPIHPQGFVPDDPNNPGSFGVHFNGADNKPERGVIGKDGLFHKGGEKPEAKPKEDHLIHTQVKLDNGTVEHHIVNTRTNTYTVAKPESATPEQAAGPIKYVRGADGTMTIAR